MKNPSERIIFCTGEKHYQKNKILYRWKKPTERKDCVQMKNPTERIRLCTDEKPYWKDMNVHRWKTLSL